MFICDTRAAFCSIDQAQPDRFTSQFKTENSSGAFGAVPADADRTATAGNWIDINPIRGGKHETEAVIPTV